MRKNTSLIEVAIGKKVQYEDGRIGILRDIKLVPNGTHRPELIAVLFVEVEGSIVSATSNRFTSIEDEEYEEFYPSVHLSRMSERKKAEDIGEMDSKTAEEILELASKFQEDCHEFVKNFKAKFENSSHQYQDLANVWIYMKLAQLSHSAKKKVLAERLSTEKFMRPL